MGKGGEAGYTFVPALVLDSVNQSDQLNELVQIRLLNEREMMALQYLVQVYWNKQVGELLLLSKKR